MTTFILDLLICLVSFEAAKIRFSVPFFSKMFLSKSWITSFLVLIVLMDFKLCRLQFSFPQVPLSVDPLRAPESPLPVELQSLRAQKSSCNEATDLSGILVDKEEALAERISSMALMFWLL